MTRDAARLVNYKVCLRFAADLVAWKALVLQCFYYELTLTYLIILLSDRS